MKRQEALSGPLKRLRGYLWDTKFRTISDRKAPESNGKGGDHNGRVERWLEFLAVFDYTVEYRSGSANGNADFLSACRNRPLSTARPQWV